MSNKNHNNVNIITNNPVVCNCFDVKASTIKMVIESGNAKTVEDVSELTFAGTGCRSCLCRIERILAGSSVQCGPCAFCPACGVVPKLCKCEYA